MEHSVSANDWYFVCAAGDGTGGEVIILDGWLGHRSRWCSTRRGRDCTGRPGGHARDVDKEEKDGTVRESVDTARRLPNGTQKTLYAHLPELINLQLDPASQTRYWTDRVDLPLGDTLNHADV
ncbi:hypothetical protein FIBSPDRAFT_1040310 [Athelia psychrophila]|uniref:Uncharacterized protein n=1 Tax=Athelia psychrophila TaxID=1759441 RepID=A0A166QG77_9AGAM|nr:hypothetical protein FIBSPDRAFT_1040310 [Fibularhizoctonia sp. CBS 109695]